MPPDWLSQGYDPRGAYGRDWRIEEYDPRGAGGWLTEEYDPVVERAAGWRSAGAGPRRPCVERLELVAAVPHTAALPPVAAIHLQESIGRMRLRLGMVDAMGSRSFAVPDRVSEARGIQLIANRTGRRSTTPASRSG